MSVSGISSTSFYDTQSLQNNFQQVQQAFQQLGQDLQSGNLSGAQSDFATLQKLQPQNNSSTSSQSDSPIAQAFQQLSSDLQSGNLSAAQQDYSTIQQAFQSQAAQAQTAQSSATQGHHHHHHHGGGSSGASSSGGNQISQLLTQLGSALQSGDLSTAQSTYNSLVSDFQQFAQSNGLQTSSSGTSNTNSISVNA